jgi:hypothetical protein
VCLTELSRHLFALQRALRARRAYGIDDLHSSGSRMDQDNPYAACGQVAAAWDVHTQVDLSSVALRARPERLYKHTGSSRSHYAAGSPWILKPCEMLPTTAGVMAQAAAGCYVPETALQVRGSRHWMVGWDVPPRRHVLHLHASFQVVYCKAHPPLLLPSCRAI